jgi:hypothetical protein
MTGTRAMTITLSDEECSALVEQVTTIVGQTGVNGEQGVEVLCSALAIVLASHDVSLAAITRRRCNEPRQGRIVVKLRGNGALARGEDPRPFARRPSVA